MCSALLGCSKCTVADMVVCSIHLQQVSWAVLASGVHAHLRRLVERIVVGMFCVVVMLTSMLTFPV